jgi:hypothetical protein
MENVYVKSFLIPEKESWFMREILDYLDPKQGVHIVYIKDGEYFCTFDNNTFIKVDEFKYDFPEVLITSTKSPYSP